MLFRSFRVFGEHSPELEDNDGTDDEDDSEDVDFHNIASILDEDTQDVLLPPHQKCACHLLNLIATAVNINQSAKIALSLTLDVHWFPRWCSRQHVILMI